MKGTSVSAPGKVLLAGGYLVLDRQYTGLVFGLSARIHVIVQPFEAIGGTSEPPTFIVRSPQFKDAEWIYKTLIAPYRGGVEVTQLESSSGVTSKNIFVETALCYALTYILSVTQSETIKPSTITILADNDYYSQPSNAISSETSTTQQFQGFGVRLQDAHKTGLGSSAALVTAFTGALLSHYLSEAQFRISSPEGNARLHNLAQAAHCAAQGKVGSGFDVAAAVYGTCMYRRFSPSLLSDISEPNNPSFSVRLQESVEESSAARKWDTEIQKSAVSIPEGMALIMCDVDCGSQTVGMVKQVLQWRKTDPTAAKDLWDELQRRNETLAKCLLSGSPAELAAAIEADREYIRDMGKRSGVPIEPVEQTQLLDALTTRIEGVYGGVVPGAGGYDAVALLVKNDTDTLARIESFLREWSVSKSSNVKLLRVKGEMEGVRKEDDRSYAPWIK